MQHSTLVRDCAGDHVVVTVCKQADRVKVRSEFDFPESGTYMVYTAKQAKRLEKALKAARRAMKAAI